MTVKTIRDVDEETWRIMKGVATREKLKMGILLKEMVKEYKWKPSASWNKILVAKSTLTKKEADAMLKTVAKLRKESGYRDVIT